MIQTAVREIQCRFAMNTSVRSAGGASVSVTSAGEAALGPGTVGAKTCQQ
jgi:hypothetical protein